MKAYIKAIAERAWRAILTGWTHPTVTIDEEEPSTEDIQKAY